MWETLAAGISCITACHLAKQGKDVTVYEALVSAMSVGSLAIFRPTGLFNQYGVKVKAHTQIYELENHFVNWYKMIYKIFDTYSTGAYGTITDSWQEIIEAGEDGRWDMSNVYHEIGVIIGFCL